MLEMLLKPLEKGKKCFIFHAFTIFRLIFCLLQRYLCPDFNSFVYSLLFNCFCYWPNSTWGQL